MKACVLTIGNELLQGFTIDTNSAWLGKNLLPYDIQIEKKISVGDDIAAIIHEVGAALKGNYDYLFVTGGLGPTHDDITKEAFRQLLSDETYLDEEYYQQLKVRFEKRFKVMPESNRSQAMLLRKADSIPNENGSALGMHFFEKGIHIFVMPGVPGEMKGMFTNTIIPDYIGGTPQENQVTIKTAGVMESRLAEKVQPLMDKYAGTFGFAFLPHYTGVTFRITRLNEGTDLNMIKDEIYHAMQPYAYGLQEDTLEGVLAKKLIEKKLTIAVAESCTGGLIGKRLTDVPGSSQFFLGGVTAYCNELKLSLLDLSGETLKNHGAVSEEAALGMAIGIRKKTKADIGISSTGISGPGGGSKEKPVGLVYIAFSSKNNSFVKKYQIETKRHIHRELTATAALNITRLAIEY